MRLRRCALVFKQSVDRYTMDWLLTPHSHSSSHYEMAGWEIIPAIVLLFFFIGGGVQVIKARKKQGPKEKRGESLRKKLPLPLIIATPVTQSFSVTTYDISTDGAFIPLNEMRNSMNFTSLIGKRSGLKVGDIIDVTLHTGRFSQIHCQGRVVRKEIEQLGQYPEGFGIQFLKLSRRDQKRLELILQSPDDEDVLSIIVLMIFFIFLSLWYF